MMVSKDVSSMHAKEASIFKPLPLTLEEVFNGAIKKLIISKRVMKDDRVNFETKDKVLTVKIPPGICAQLYE
jgi:hypothetical protein